MFFLLEEVSLGEGGAWCKPRRHPTGVGGDDELCAEPVTPTSKTGCARPPTATCLHPEARARRKRQEATRGIGRGGRRAFRKGIVSRQMRNNETAVFSGAFGGDFWPVWGMSVGFESGTSESWVAFLLGKGKGMGMGDFENAIQPQHLAFRVSGGQQHRAQCAAQPPQASCFCCLSICLCR
jgi:hypothetical protein